MKAKKAGMVGSYGAVRTTRRRAVSVEDSESVWSRPGYLVRRLHQISVAIFHEEMAEIELTPVQFGVLKIAGEKKGLHQSAIGTALGVDRATMTAVVNCLARAGFIERHPASHDLRVRTIRVTAPGRAQLRKAVPKLKRVQERLLDPLNESSRDAFIAALKTLVKENNALGRAPLRLT